MIKHANLKRVMGPRKNHSAQIQNFNKSGKSVSHRSKKSISKSESVLDSKKQDGQVVISGDLELLGIFKKQHKRRFTLTTSTLTCTKDKNDKDKKSVFELMTSDISSIGVYPKKRNLGIEIYSSLIDRTIIFPDMDLKFKWLRHIRENSQQIKYYFRNVVMWSEFHLVDKLKKNKEKSGVIVTKNCLYITGKNNIHEILVSSTSFMDVLVNKMKKLIIGNYLIKNMQIMLKEPTKKAC